MLLRQNLLLAISLVLAAAIRNIEDIDVTVWFRSMPGRERHIARFSSDGSQMRAWFLLERPGITRVAINSIADRSSIGLKAFK